MLTFKAMRIAKYVEELRRQTRKSPSDIAEAGIMSAKTLRRLESAERIPKWPAVTELCRFLGADEATIYRMRGLVLQCDTLGHDERTNSTTIRGFHLLRELEAEATNLQIVEEAVIPGICQSEGYARELIAHYPGINESDIDDIAADRVKRADTVTGEVQVLTVDHVWRGGRDWRFPPNANIQIRTSPPIVSVGSFRVMKFDDYRPIVYTETLAGSVYHEQPDIVDAYVSAFRVRWEMGCEVA